MVEYRLQKLILISEGKVMFEDWHSRGLYLGTRVSPRKGEYIRGHKKKRKKSFQFKRKYIPQE